MQNARAFKNENRFNWKERKIESLKRKKECNQNDYRKGVANGRRRERKKKANADFVYQRISKKQKKKATGQSHACM